MKTQKATKLIVQITVKIEEKNNINGITHIAYVVHSECLQKTNLSFKTNSKTFFTTFEESNNRIIKSKKKNAIRKSVANYVISRSYPN